jgi:iron complex outermembrane recepter protein
MTRKGAWAGQVLVILVGAGSVWVAAADEQMSTEPEQITVTGIRSKEDSSVATKTATPLIETPQSISVIGSDQIDLQAAESLGEALRYAAGVNPEQYGGVDQRIDWFVIRGFQSSAPYIDGLTSNSRYTLMSPKVDPYGLDRIEVLRGPSSVLYGQNVPGGLINVVSKRPQDVAAGELEVQAGDYGRLEGRADVTGPLDADHTLLYRLTGSILGSGTQVDHVDNHHYFFAPALTWRPDDGTGVTLLAHFLRQDDGFALQNLPAAGTLYPSPYGKISTSLFTGEPGLNYATLTQWDVGYNAEHRFSLDWTVHQNLRYTRSKVGLGYVAGYEQEADAPQVMDRFALAAAAHQDNFAVDSNVEGHLVTGSINHTLLVGIDFSRSHDFWSEDDGGAAPLDLTHPVYGGPISLVLDYVTDDLVKQTGVYAQDQMKVDHLVLTGSVRRDWAQTETVDVLDQSYLNQHDKALTGRGGAVYLFDSGLAPYVSYSTSFQPTIGTTFYGVPLNPTTATQWEAGLKFQPKGAASFGMMSAYDIEEKNITTPDPDPDHPNQVVQTGGARVKGIELSGDLDLGYDIAATVAYSYMSSTITAANDGTVGNELMDVARNSASAWLKKRMDIFGEQHLTLGGGVRYIGPRFGDNANTLLLPGATQIDALARYEIANWGLSLNVRNLADRIVIATCDSTARCFYNDRRSILATLDYRW